MSMNSVFVHVTEEQIEQLLAAPAQVNDLLTPDLPFQPERALNIEKTWQAVHWLLTDSSDEGEPPLNFILHGGSEIDDGQSGYGPPRAFRSVQVRAISDALASISAAQLLSKYDGHAMRDLYPWVWDRADEEAMNRADLALQLDALRRFMTEAVERGQGAIIYMV